MFSSHILILTRYFLELFLFYISKDFSVDDIKNWIKGYVYDFNVDYNDTAVDDVLGIDNYLMKKMG